MIDQDAQQIDLDALRTAVDGRTAAVAAPAMDRDVPQPVVDASEADLDVPTTDLALLAIDPDAYKVALASHGSVLAVRESDVAGCEVAVDDGEFARAGLLFALARLEIGLAGLETDVAVLETDVAVLETDLAVLETAVDLRATDGAGLFSALARLATNLDALESRVDAPISAGAADATRPGSLHRVHHTLFLEGSMQLPELHVLDTGQRVQGFLTSQGVALGTAVPAPLRGQLDAAVTQAMAAQADQATLVGSIKGETATQAAIRTTITTDFLRPIATAARHALKDASDFATLVPPAKLRKADFASTVTAVATAAANHQQVFLDHGEPVDFVAQLQAAVTTFQASTDRRALLVGRQSAATKSAGDSVKTIRSVLKVINGALTPVLKKNAPLKANWLATKRIQPTVVTPLPGGDAGGTTTTPQAPAVNAAAKPAA